MSLTLAVWSREAVAARARGPPKPQHRSVMGRLCRDQTCRGSGIWEGSACNTLWGEQRQAGQPRTEPHGELGQPLLPLGTPLLAAGTKLDTGAAGSHGTQIPRLRSLCQRDKHPR